MQVLEFPRGNLYQIVCADGNQALRVQATDPQHYEKSRVVGVQPNVNDLGQLFMIEKVGHGDDQYEIVNCLANLVWDEEGSEIKLKFGNQSNDQLFKVEKANNNGAYWFKTSSKGKQAVALEGVLRYKPFDPNAPNQLFFIAPANNVQGLAETAIIANKNSGKVLDIPEGTFKHGVRIVQYAKNKRFNQRWRWVKNGGGYLIQSLLTNQCLDIEGQKSTNGSSVVQWDRTGGSNQTWLPVKTQEPGVYRIKSNHAPGQYLHIKNADIEDGGKLQINDQDSPGSYWRIEGFVPPV